MHLAGLFGMASAVLILAGVRKVATPAPVVAALRTVGLRVPVVVVRLGAAIEALIGGLALATGWPVLAAGVGLCYLAFVAFVSVRLVRGDEGSCGCFGDVDAQPTATHMVLSLAGAAIGLVAVVSPVPDALSLARADPLASVTLAAFMALGCWFTYLALTALPALVVARTERGDT